MESNGIQLIANHHQVMQAIENNPGIRLRDLKVMTDNSRAGTILQHLLYKGLIRKEGTMRTYQIYSTGKSYRLLKNEADREQEEKEPDLLIEDAMNLKLTKQQLKFLKENSNLPRRQLAKELGISKVALNLHLAGVKKI